MSICSVPNELSVVSCKWSVAFENTTDDGRLTTNRNALFYKRVIFL
jgi:hypothetical protein